MAIKLSKSHHPLETTLAYLSDKWKFLIIGELLSGTKRFGELQKSIGNISQKVLTSNLRALEEDGLLVRNVYPEIPPRVEYTLTEKGESLAGIIKEMRAWGKRHMGEDKAAK